MTRFVPFKEDSVLTEAKGKLTRYIHDINKSFGLISVVKPGIGRVEFDAKMRELSREVRRKYGYSIVRGAGASEMFLFVPNITRRDIVLLARKFEQEQVVLKVKDDFLVIGDGGVKKIHIKTSDGIDHVNVAEDAVARFVEWVSGLYPEREMEEIDP